MGSVIDKFRKLVMLSDCPVIGIFHSVLGAIPWKSMSSCMHYTGSNGYCDEKARGTTLVLAHMTCWSAERIANGGVESFGSFYNWKWTFADFLSGEDLAADFHFTSLRSFYTVYLSSSRCISHREGANHDCFPRLTGLLPDRFFHL